MFHSAAVKLTLWYLAIILGLSICFSLVIYNLSSQELVRNYRHQTVMINNQLAPFDVDNFNRQRMRDLDEGLHHLKINLVLFNVMVLIGGGAASYALARRTLEPIEEALDAQKRFTGDASHELRTPLTVMLTENEVALRNPNLTKKEAVEQLKSNLEEVGKLKSLSDGLLRLTSLESTDFANRKVSLKAVSQKAIDRWVKVAEAKNIKLVYSPKDVTVTGDGDSLTELISILLDNAIKYSPEKSSINLSIGRSSKSAYVKVKDQGRGMAAKDLPKIFERFYQADSSRSGEAKGYGLGLSIAKRIAELHDGSIEVSSAPGKGSTFTVHLPAA